MLKELDFDGYDIDDGNFPPTYVVEEVYDDGKLIRKEQIAKFKYPLDGVMFLHFIDRCYETEDTEFTHKFTVYIDDGSKYGCAPEDDIEELVNKIVKMSDIVNSIMDILGED